MLKKISELAKSNPKISDFHLRGGSDIACRIMGDIVIEKNSKIENKDIEELLKKNCSEEEIKIFNTKKELDCAIMLENLRYRVNFYKTRQGLFPIIQHFFCNCTLSGLIVLFNKGFQLLNILLFIHIE